MQNSPFALDKASRIAAPFPAFFSSRITRDTSGWSAANRSNTPREPSCDPLSTTITSAEICVVRIAANTRSKTVLIEFASLYMAIKIERRTRGINVLSQTLGPMARSNKALTSPGVRLVPTTMLCAADSSESTYHSPPIPNHLPIPFARHRYWIHCGSTLQSGGQANSARRLVAVQRPAPVSVQQLRDLGDRRD